MNASALRLKVPFVIDSPLELLCLLRHLRIRRDLLWSELLAIEEQHRGGVQDETRMAQHHRLNADLAVLDEIIRRLWVSSARRHDAARKK